MNFRLPLMFHTNTKSLKTTGLIEFKVQRRTELTVAEGLSSAWPSLLTVLKGPAPSEGLSPCGHKQTMHVKVKVFTQM